ncbi:hypothetical protein [Sphingomonas sp. LaA6.9]|uniref:hypothetical protein n=1 Tax=Sphingomonas sp. LaA6.9 TaxID=2919914 RepID=UPI001F4FFC27|nr:hypothetical protein [Sphingomonas sp. LaA6.9]MCJ8159199.1 hypothetical protein [Sphingomonas sp. LaA6.9]
MRMLLTISATVAALAGTSAIAASSTETTFEHDGYTYIYKSEVNDGRKVISGRRFPGNVPFRLVVNNGRVRGTTDGRPVSFKLSEIESLNAGEQIAAR